MFLDRWRALSQCQPEEQETVIKLIDGANVKHQLETALSRLISRGLQRLFSAGRRCYQHLNPADQKQLSRS
jgi:hypothetical protein